MKLLLLLVVVVYFISGIRCITWSNVTSSELTDLPTSAFASINSTELASIPPQACTGFSSSQIAAIPPNSIIGFSAEQLAQLTYACSGFTSGQIVNVDSSAFFGVTSRCFVNFDSGAYSGLQAAQVSNFNDSLCSSTSLYLNKIPVTAISGMTAQCMSLLSISACESITAALFAGFSPSALVGLRRQCAYSMPTPALSMATANQTAAFTTSACNGFWSNQIQNLSPAGASGLTEECVASFTTSTSGACAGLASTVVAELTAGAVHGLSEECVYAAPVRAFDHVTASFFVALNPTSCHGFWTNQVQSFPAPAASGVTTECAANFTTSGPNGCAGFQSEFIGNMTPQGFAGFTDQCLFDMSVQAFSSMTAQQFAAMDPARCGSFWRSQVENFPPSAAPGVSAQCLGHFTDMLSTSGCSGLAEDFVANLTPETFSGFSASCIYQTKETVFRLVTAEQLQHVYSDSFNGFRNQLAYVSNATIEGVHLIQLLYLPGNLGGLTAEQLVILFNKYGLELVQRWTLPHTSNYNLLNAARFKQFIPTRVPYLTSWIDVSVTPSNVTWFKIALLKTDPQPVLDSTVISQLPESAIMGLRADHVGLISAASFSAFTPAQAAFFTNDTTAAITAEQLVAMQDITFGNLSRLGTYGLNPAIIPNITDGQIQHMGSEMIEVMTCPQLASFTESQLNQFDSFQRSSYRRAQESLCGVSTPLFNTPEGTQSPSNPGPGLTPGEIALIVFGCLLGVGVIAGAVMFFVKRRRADPTVLQPLLA